MGGDELTRSPEGQEPPRQRALAPLGQPVSVAPGRVPPPSASRAREDASTEPPAPKPEPPPWLRFAAAAAFLAAAVIWAGLAVCFIFYSVSLSAAVSAAAVMSLGNVPENYTLAAFQSAVRVLIFVVLAATKSLFKSRGFHSANGIIIAMMAVDALALPGAFAAIVAPDLTFVFVAGGLAFFVLAIFLGIHMLRFARLAGGIWTATAVLYFVLAALMLGSTVLIVPLLMINFYAVYFLFAAMGFCALFVLAPTMICHGIGLLAAGARAPIS